MSVFIRVEGLDPEDLTDAEAHDLADRLFADIERDYPDHYDDLSGVIPVLDEDEHARLVEVSNIEQPTEADETTDAPTVSFGPLDRDDLDHVGDASDLDSDEYDWVDACGHAYVRVDEDKESQVMTDGGQSTDDSHRPFGERTAACNNCRVDESNAVETMEAVLSGERDPEKWWCDIHIKDFNGEMQEWVEEKKSRTDGGSESTDDLHEVIFETIAHADAEAGGAPVGAVVEDVLAETTADVADVGLALRDLYFTGSIYQPAPTTLATATAYDEVPTPTIEYCVPDNGMSITYGPWDADGGEWSLQVGTESDRQIRLLLGEAAMYELWTEIQHVPWPRDDDPAGDLREEIVEKINGMDEDQLREVLDVVDAASGREQ